MSEDVVFVVLQGVVAVTSGADEEIVEAPGAAYVPGSTVTRSLRAVEPSLLLAVLCRGASGGSGPGKPAGQAAARPSV